MKQFADARPCVLAIVFLAGALVPLTVEAAKHSDGGTVTFVLENDTFIGVDRYYTNGVQVFWTPRATRQPDWARKVARQIPWLPEEGVVRHGYAYGQSIFTPSDTALVEPPVDDRPYAGWLYGTVGLTVVQGRQLDQLSLTLGVVGPASLAEQAQTIIHDVLGGDEPRGWHTQLSNEPGVVLTYQRSWRGLAPVTLLGLELDFIPHIGGTLGNVFTFANAGLTVRYGGHLPVDHGPPRIQRSLLGSVVFAPREGFEWYAFAGLDGRVVARDIFLDGNSFRDSRRVDREPLVGDIQFGIVFAWHAARLSYTHVLRTREFASQRENDRFGAISISVPF
jgi:lipid A 3-O-deacylase